MKKLPLLWIVSILFVIGENHCHGDIVVTAVETGGNVVFSGGGTANIDGLVQDGLLAFGSAGLNSNFEMGTRFAVNMLGGSVDGYSVSGPTNIGPDIGFFIAADSAFGDAFGVGVSIVGIPRIAVPDGYVSESSISGTMTFLGKSFASLGLEPGTYVWTWNTNQPGSSTDSFTLRIGANAIPEPTTPIILSVFAVAGILVRRRRG